MTGPTEGPVLPTGAQYEIIGTTSFGRAVVTVTEVAASLRSFTVDDVDIVQRYPLDAPPSRGAGIIMSPWPNRVDGGIWTYEGDEQQLDITDTEFGNASHGLLKNTPYRLLAHSASSITLGATIFAHPGYPFVVDTTVTYTLGRDGLHVTHTFENRGALRAPVAVGSHAYFRIGEVPTSELVLSCSAETVYVNDSRKLPLRPVPVSGDFDLRRGVKVGDVELDDCFTDQRYSDERTSTMLTAPDGRSVTVWGDESFGHTVICTTDVFLDEHRLLVDAIAIEPQTAAVNALNNGIGLTWLEPGESWEASWGVTASL
ncbi:aldose 1-epimerase family protein [Subtercola boreus]|uniref:aldose 1-epimerase family protein n=1 Tax=Subtercola boreus TaxID=120213 RepID=UPI0011692ED6|nr:aldose 1-epimerase family protein [Subtercola boreus]TQL52704.1 aldose 1-epimerase [Subtercola boreus]